jgi:hypothetical protein
VWPGSEAVACRAPEPAAERLSGASCRPVRATAAISGRRTAQDRATTGRADSPGGGVSSVSPVKQGPLQISSSESQPPRASCRGYRASDVCHRILQKGHVQLPGAAQSTDSQWNCPSGRPAIGRIRCRYRPTSVNPEFHSLHCAIITRYTGEVQVCQWTDQT